MAITGKKWSQQPTIKIGDSTYICSLSGNGETFINAIVDVNDFVSTSGGTITGGLNVMFSGYTVDIITPDGFIIIKDINNNTLFSIDKQGNVTSNGNQLVDTNTALAFSIAL